MDREINVPVNMQKCEKTKIVVQSPKTVKEKQEELFKNLQKAENGGKIHDFVPYVEQVT